MTKLLLLQLLTWNVYMLPFPIKISRQTDRSVEIAKQMEKSTYDFVIFQEAFADYFVEDVTRALRSKMPYIYHLKKGPGITKFFNAGLLMFSRYPFKVLGEKYFENCAIADCFASKGVVLVELTVEEKKVQLAVTHMQASSEPKMRVIRGQQLEVIKSLLKTHEKAGIPQLLLGDLNIDGLGHDEYPEALAHMQMKALPLIGERSSSVATETDCFGLDNSTKLQRLDHIWIRQGVTLHNDSNQKIYPIKGIINKRPCDLSDHLPVTATLVL